MCLNKMNKSKFSKIITLSQKQLMKLHILYEQAPLSVTVIILIIFSNTPRLFPSIRSFSHWNTTVLRFYVGNCQQIVNVPVVVCWMLSFPCPQPIVYRISLESSMFLFYGLHVCHLSVVLCESLAESCLSGEWCFQWMLIMSAPPGITTAYHTSPHFPFIR